MFFTVLLVPDLVNECEDAFLTEPQKHFNIITVDDEGTC